MPLVSSAPDAGTATAAVLQGNVPRLGLDFNAQRRAVLDNHVARTEQLVAGRVARPDFVVWPENASDIDPFGETMPLRSVLRLFSAGADRVSRDFVPGSEPGVRAVSPPGSAPSPS